MIMGALAAVVLMADVSRLQWLTGTWEQAKDGVTVRETWRRTNGALTGVGETTRPGKPASVERMTITAEPAGLTFTAIIEGQPPTPFVLTPGAEGFAVFENRAHDFPQRVIYRRCGVDLCAAIEGTVDGKLRRQDWRYRRVN